MMWLFLIVVIVLLLLISQNPEVTPATAWETFSETPLSVIVEPVAGVIWVVMLVVLIIIIGFIALGAIAWWVD